MTEKEFRAERTRDLARGHVLTLCSTIPVREQTLFEMWLTQGAEESMLEGTPSADGVMNAISTAINSLKKPGATDADFEAAKETIRQAIHEYSESDFESSVATYRRCTNVGLFVGFRLGLEAMAEITADPTFIGRPEEHPGVKVARLLSNPIACDQFIATLTGRLPAAHD